VWVLVVVPVVVVVVVRVQGEVDAATADAVTPSGPPRSRVKR
jgi:hypothetical protein